MYLSHQLCVLEVFPNIKNPHCFQKSTIIPVPNKSTASCLNDYKRIALTSVVRKTLERLAIRFLKSIIDPLLDRFQFAYRENKSVDDAVSLGLFYVLQHLASPSITSKLFEKIQNVGVPQSMCLWILEFFIE